MLGRLHGLLISLVCFPSAVASAQVVSGLEDKELKPLASSLTAYFVARASADQVATAKTAFTKSLAAVRTGPKGAHPLKQQVAIKRALWLASNYDKAKVRKGKVTEETQTEGTFGIDGLAYAYRLPKKYDPAENAYPLILAIPDEGERPADHIRTYWAGREFRDGAILVSPAMPEVQAEWAAVMVKGRPGGLCHVLSALRIAQDRFAVDFERIYVSGHGKSVPAATAAGNYSPQRFAGIIGRAGDIGELGPDNFQNLATYFAGSGEQAKAFQKAAEQLGFSNCTLDPAGGEAQIWTWLEGHKRQATPDKVNLLIGQPYPTRVNWLRVAPTAPDAHATAIINRASNSIEVESKGASHVTLYLNDELIDLDLRVLITRNGVQESHTIRRSMPTTLDLLHSGVSDPGCVYVAQIRLDMREGAVAKPNDAPPLKDAEFEKRQSAAGDNVDKLWALHEWCMDEQRSARSPVVLRKLIRLQPDLEGAHLALGHEFGGGQWFTRPESLARFLKGQEEPVATQRGYKLQNGLWMHPDDVTLSGKGRVKDNETGLWRSAADRKRLKEGWTRQDLEWITPQEAHQVDQGLWLVDGEWLSLPAANQRHLSIDSMWHIPGAEVLLHTTVGRETALSAMEHMSRAVEDLRRVFGAQPQFPLQVTMLHDEEQYDSFAFGDPDGRRLATHAGRLQTVRSAFFAESWFPRAAGKSTFAGMGVSYWDALDPNGNAFGVHAARLVIGLSYIDALDPSPKAVRKALSKGIQAGYYEAHQAEKTLPAWLRNGGAVYAERFFRDDSVAADGDPWWARKWSLGSLSGRGGLEGIKDIFALELDPEKRDASIRLLLESGALVAFMVDGGCAPVMEQHELFKKALMSGRLRPSQIRDLEAVLLAHEEELRVFAGG